MPWVKLTDDWYDDPLVVAAGDDGGWLWVVGLSWCARNLTDGVIPSRQVSRLVTLDDPPTVAAHLVELGLWTTHPDGFEVANYHRYQPTRESVLAQREADAKRKRRSRESTDAPGNVRPDSERIPSPPVPGPVPDTPSSSSVLPVDSVHGVAVDDVLDIVADLRLAANQAAGKIKTSPARWRDRCRENLPDEKGARAVELLEAFDIDARTCAEIVEGTRTTQYLTRRGPVSNGASR